MNRWSKFSLVFLQISTLLISVAPAEAASIQGSKCTKAGISKTVGSVTYTCVKSGKNLMWKKAVAEKSHPEVKPTPSPTPTPSVTPTPASTPIPLPASFEISPYTGGPGVAVAPVVRKSQELPADNIAPGSDYNLKLWLYDPENEKKTLNTNGVFIQPSGGEWTLVRASYGYVTTQLKPGNYLIDVIEPEGQWEKYSRGRYSVVVDGRSNVAITGLLPNSKNYFAVTVIVNPTKASQGVSFNPTSPCQLRDQSGNTAMSNGFPRGSGRLTSNGKVRALIIPVDFTDLSGSGNPSEIYADMAKGTRDFYYKESNKRVLFEFTTVNEYLHLNVPVVSFKLGSYNGGDPGAFFKAGLAAADPLVDFTLFDVVYVLPPKTVSFNQIAYGPAFPILSGRSDFPTSDGPVMNGSVGGADAWQSLEGAGWKWMAHETGHLFGLYDWYTLDGRNPYGPWDLMSLNWNTAAIELNAWNRYISGWLSNAQIQCVTKNELTSAGKDYSVEVIGVDSENPKAVTVKLSDSLVLVMEARATAGLDKLPANQSGLLVYTVDLTVPTIKGMAETYSRPGVSPTLDDAPLRVGETITVKGVTIKVTSFEGSTLSLHINS